MKGISITKRAGGLLLAVVLAAFATVALISYVHGVQQKAFAGTETVEVYTARETIPAGTSGEEAVKRALIDTTAVPRTVAAEGAIGSLDQLRGRVAAVTILKGEQILAARFVAPESAGATIPIPTGQMAMTVEVDVPHGVGGYVTPGSHISIVAHLDQPGARGSQAVEPTARFVVQDVQVLAVGQHVATVAAQGDRAQAKQQQQQVSTDQVMVTLAVTPAQAEKLAFATFEGDIYFTLLPPDGKSVSTSGRSMQTEFK